MNDKIEKIDRNLRNYNSGKHHSESIPAMAKHLVFLIAEYERLEKENEKLRYIMACAKTLTEIRGTIHEDGRREISVDYKIYAELQQALADYEKDSK